MSDRVGRTGRAVTRRAPGAGRRVWGPAVAVLTLAAAVGCGTPPAPDLVLVNARIFTANPAQPWAEALAIRGDRIVSVGTTADVSALASATTVRRDIGGRTLIPGLNDAHVADPGGGSAAIRDRAREATASGVASMQWFVGGRTVKEVGQALVEADIPIRVRVLRMPRPGPDGETIDSRPHLPPQPSPRVDIRGMAFALGVGDEPRVREAVGWAFATEDLLAIEPRDQGALEAYLFAVESRGLPEVWRRKRPRIEKAGTGLVPLVSRAAEAGMVIVQQPHGPAPLASVLARGATLALASGAETNPLAVLAWATSPERGAERLTMEQALAAMTRGAAYAEHADRDKGHLSVGALADLAVLSVDPFTATPDELTRGRSVLTMIGGRIVHDVP